MSYMKEICFDEILLLLIDEIIIFLFLREAVSMQIYMYLFLYKSMLSMYSIFCMFD